MEYCAGIMHTYDDATILMSDQLQADRVLQSMSLLFHWA